MTDAEKLLLCELLAGQRELLAELSKLRADLAGREPARSMRHQDRAVMGKILPVLAAHYPGTFSTWEILDAAAGRDALGANLRLVLGTRTAQQLGKLFQRTSDHDIDGILIHRAGQDENGARWECIANPSS